MTRREFDALTRINFGEPMASDERESYRQDRLLPYKPRCRGRAVPLRIDDRLLRKQRYRSSDGTIRAMELGSPHRAPIKRLRDERRRAARKGQ